MGHCRCKVTSPPSWWLRLMWLEEKWMTSCSRQQRWGGDGKGSARSLQKKRHDAESLKQSTSAEMPHRCYQDHTATSRRSNAVAHLQSLWLLVGMHPTSVPLKTSVPGRHANHLGGVKWGRLVETKNASGAGSESQLKTFRVNNTDERHDDVHGAVADTK